jgi:hypothetical protein
MEFKKYKSATQQCLIKVLLFVPQKKLVKLKPIQNGILGKPTAALDKPK